MTKEFFNPEPRVFAHRGLPLEYPENTMISFKNAYELGVDVIETDIHFTTDKKFVVIHDDVLERVSNGKGRVIDYSLKELKKLNPGYNFTKDNGESYPFRDSGQTFLSLEELFEEFPNQKFNIDLKDENPEQVKYYVDLIKKYNAQIKVLTSSKYNVNLKKLRKLIPEMATSFSRKEVAGFYFLSKTRPFFENLFNGDALQIPEYFGPMHLTNKSLVKQAKEMGFRFNIYTINKENDMKRLFNLGMDGFFTDDARLLKRVVSDYFDCNLNKVCF